MVVSDHTRQLSCSKQHNPRPLLVKVSFAESQANVSLTVFLEDFYCLLDFVFSIHFLKIYFSVYECLLP